MKSNAVGMNIYKPTKKGNGSVAQFQPGVHMEEVWLEITSQRSGVPISRKKDLFDWSQKITMKLGHSDLIALISVFEIVKTAMYKTLLRTDTEKFDNWMKSLCLKDRSGKKGDELLNLYHSGKDGSDSRLVVCPNGASYRGGFRLKVFKTTTDGDKLSHYIAISPEETVGLIYVLEKPLRLAFKIEKDPEEDRRGSTKFRQVGKRNEEQEEAAF